MWDFIVLGLVPGTGVQLGFLGMLCLEVVVLAVIISGWKLRHNSPQAHLRLSLLSNKLLRNR